MWKARGGESNRKTRQNRANINDNRNYIDKLEQHKKEELGRRWIMKLHAKEAAKRRQVVAV